MKIDMRNEECVYITINGFTYYIDDSTGEQIVEIIDDTNNSRLDAIHNIEYAKKKYSNDTELGAEIRKIITNIKQ